VQDQQTQCVLSGKSNNTLFVEAKTSHYFKNDPVKSSVQQSSTEVTLLDDKLSASQRKEIKNFDENCDITSTTSNQTSSVKRKLCIEDETLDVIPATPIVKASKLSLSCKHTKLNANEGTCTQQDKSSGGAAVKVIRQIFGDIPTNKKKTMKDNENEDCIGLNNTSDCKTLDRLLEKVESHNVNNQDMKCDNFPFTDQYVNDAATGCDTEGNSLEQLIDTKDNISVISKFDGSSDNNGSCVPGTGTMVLNDEANMHVAFLEDSFLNNSVVSKIKVSDCNIPKATVKQSVDLNDDGFCTSIVLKINKSKARECTDILQLKCRYNCSTDSSKAFGCDFLSSQDKTEESAVVSKGTVSSEHIDLQELSSKPDSVNLGASDCSFQKSGKCANVLCSKVQTTSVVSAFQQVKTESCAEGSNNITQKNHPAWLSSEDWDFSLIDEKKIE
jgi:hypothetical protein